MSELFKDSKRTDFSGIEKWNVSNVTSMGAMFAGCHDFNQDISSWDVANVTNMSGMFAGCTSFNQPLNNWNVSKVEDMSQMFAHCEKFNQPLNDWNVREDCLTNDIFKHTKHLEFKYFYESFTQDQIFKSGKSNIDPHFFRMTKEAFERYSSVESYGPLNAYNIDKKSFRRS